MQKKGRLIVLSLLSVAVLLYYLATSATGERVKRAAEIKAASVVGNIAARNMSDDVAGGFHNIPIEVVQLADNVYQARGIANTHLITTAEGSVLFDSGISIQAAQQLELLKARQQGPLTHIILSHSHADHIGGVRFWRDKATEIVAHREFAEEQRYLTELEPYLWARNRIVFPWMPEQPTRQPMLRYGGIEPTIAVDHRDYHFRQGGVEFAVLATPGAEGADNLSLWLPEQKILFSGDFFGPLWPQFPNIFTMRGEKIRKPIEYIQSLDKLIALEPEMIVPSHHQPITGKENIRAGMIKMRDAVQSVHDQVVAGMNAGKTVYQLMDEVRLPAHLQLTEEHGKVSWAVRSIWEYYATWFHFDSPTSLYSLPVSALYGELAALAGVEALLAEAQQSLQGGDSLPALHYLEIVLAAEPDNNKALRLQLSALQQLLTAAIAGGNNYEKDYLRAQIQQVEARLQGT